MEGGMKKLMKKLEDMMVAVTFAEAGEFDSAVEAVNERPAITETKEENTTSTIYEGVGI